MRPPQKDAERQIRPSRAAHFRRESVAARHRSLSDHWDRWPGLLAAAMPARQKRQKRKLGGRRVGWYWEWDGGVAGSPALNLESGQQRVPALAVALMPDGVR
jgi:hypothetical protein